MPIGHIELTQTFDQWRQGTNAMIDVVNTLTGSGTVLAVSGPTSGQILVYNGTMFANVTVTGDITIDSTGAASVVGGASLSKGRLRFAGAMTSLY